MRTMASCTSPSCRLWILRFKLVTFRLAVNHFSIYLGIAVLNFLGFRDWIGRTNPCGMAYSLSTTEWAYALFLGWSRNLQHLFFFLHTANICVL